MKNHPTCTFGASGMQRISKPKSIPVEYGDWLNTKPWDFFCTFSTRYPLSVRSARRAMERFHSNVSRTFPECNLFWAAEPFDTKESFHLHALIRLPHSPTKKAKDFIKTSWQVVSKGGGGKKYNHTVLRPYQKNKGAHYYVGKYIQHPLSDYDYFF